MRKAKYDLPIWPYIGAVACLFMLSVLAPFTWRNVVTSRPATWNVAVRPAIEPAAADHAERIAADAAGTKVAVHKLPIQANVPVQVAAPTVRDADTLAPPVLDPGQLIAVFPAPRAKSVRPWMPPAVAVEANSLPVELSGFSAPRQRAETTPPVADRLQVAANMEPQRQSHAESLLPVATAVNPMAVAVATSSPMRPNERLITVSSDTVSSNIAPPAPQKAFAKAIPRVWPQANELIVQLRALQNIPETQAWATQAITALESIHKQESLDSATLKPLFQQLSEVAEQGVDLAEKASSEELKVRIVRTGYAVVRRELLWRQIHQIATQDVETISRASDRAAEVRLAAVWSKIDGSTNAKAWREYLRLREIRANLKQADASIRVALARDVLARMSSPKLSAAQRAVLVAHPFSDLEAELRRWVIEPIAYPQLLEDIELYEQTRSAEAAHRVAATYQVIRWSGNPDIAKFAELINSHYRNANLRVAVRDDLLNRLLPKQDEFEEEVNEEIIGARVSGSASGSARIKTVLIPDRHRWRFGLEVEGEVQSQTSATRGPATFFNDGFSRYQARKLFQVDHRGVLISDSEAVANMNSELTGFRTLFDSLPVIGWVARGIARQQHDDQTERAQWVSETRLETRMRERLDREVQEELEAAQARIEAKVIGPLERLELNPDAVEMRTTKDRLIARYRLAGDQHLGAFTPRPRAPSDSMLSVQVHETVLNNTLEQLGLDGRRTKLRQLYRDLADAFERSDLEVPEDIPENITIQFADTNPVHVRCEDGKLTLSLQIAELKNRRNSWHNFEVRAEYIPDSTRLHAHLVRDGVVKLLGDRLSFGDQIVLRTIFSRALSKNQPFNVINRKLAENPAIADLNVNQFVIADGWIGVALGPHRIARRAAPAAVITR